MTGIIASPAASGTLFTTVDRAAVEAQAIQNVAAAVGQNATDFVAPVDATTRVVMDADDPAGYQKLLAIAGKGIA